MSSVIPQTIPFIIGQPVDLPDRTGQRGTLVDLPARTVTAASAAATATTATAAATTHTEAYMTVIKRGDTLPALTIACLLDGEPVDLAGATVRILARNNDGLFIDRLVPGPADGVVVLHWEPGDTETVGTLRVEVEVTWPDGLVQTWPGHGSIRVDVTPDLNPPTGA